MSTFVFTDPNGRQHTVTGPPGATQEQAFGVLQQRLGAVPPPAAPPRAVTGAGSRFLTGLMDPVVGAAQLADRTGIPGLIRKGLGIEGNMEDVVKQRDAEYVAPEGIDWARMAGGVAPSLVTGGIGGLAGRALPAAAARLAPQAGMSAARGGAVQAALAPTEAGLDLEAFAKAKAVQAGVGGALGAVLPRAMGGLFKPSDDARALQRAGVTLTPGQAVGGKLGELEEKLMSTPVAGDLISKARSRSLDDFQKATLQQRIVGLPKGIKDVEDARDFVSELYEKATPFIKPTAESKANVKQALTDALANPELLDTHRKVLKGIVESRFKRYDELDGAALKRLDSELGHLARKWRSGSASPSDKTLSDEIYNVQAGMREGWAAGMSPDKAWDLHMANDAFRLLIPVRKAANQHGERVMPKALARAVSRHTGNDMSRVLKDDQFLGAAVRTLPNKVPDSGTASRLLTPAAIVGGLAAPGAALPALAGALAAAGAYTRTGSNFLTGNTAAQRALAKMEPKVRRALIGALRSQQAGHEPKGE